MSEFDEVREQIDWAHTRIEMARSEINSYIKNDAFNMLREVDPDTGEVTVKVRLVNPIPVSIKGYLRNAIVDLKHSFDMSLNAAASRLSGKTTERNFPWADSPTGVRGITNKWQSKPKTRVPEEIIQEIFRQQPHRTGEGFVGGDDLTREVAKMANDKHSIGIVAEARTSGFSMASLHIVRAESVEIGLPWDTEKQELVIARYRGEVLHDNPTVTGNVFFKRVGRMGPTPAIPASVAFYNRAKKCMEGFEAICA